MLVNLEDIYIKKGKDFVDKLLNLPLIVTEKFSGSFFAFQKVNGNIQFFKKSQMITKIDRLINRYYEGAIRYIESLPDQVTLQIPNDIKFCFQYFPNTQPNYITYDKLPKNNLILTHLIYNKKETESDESEETKETIERYGDILNVSIAPVIFKGMLNDDQKLKIREYLEMTKEDVYKKFKTTSFTRFLISILNPSLSKTFLNDTLDKPIDSIIFIFKNQESNVYAKLVDPVMLDIIKQNKREEPKTDLLSIISADMIEFVEMEKDNILKIPLKSTRYDERYIDLISKLFNKFIIKSKNRYDGVEIKLPKYLDKPEFRMNPQFVSNSKTLEIITNNKVNEELFKMFLNLFKKKRNNNDAILTQSIIRYQNELVDFIDKHLMSVKTNENNFYSFNEFVDLEDILYETIDLDKLRINSESDIPGGSLDSEVILENSEYKDVDYMKVYSFWQNMLGTTAKPIQEDVSKKREVNLVIGKFQPFHKGHLKVCESLYKDTKVPVVLIQYNPNKSNENYIMNEELSRNMLDAIVSKRPKLIKEYYQFKRMNFKTILEKISSKYKINTIICKEDYQSGLLKELEYDLLEQRLNIKKEDINFKYYNNKEIKTDTYITKDIRKAIRENNYNSYKSSVPEELYGLYFTIRDKK